MRISSHLRSNWRIEFRREEIEMEVVEGEIVPDEFSNVVSLMQNRLHYPTTRVDGVLALNLREEAVELVGGHVGPTVGVFVEQLFDFRRRHCIRRLELPLEANAHSVASHCAKNRKILSMCLRLRSSKEIW